MVYFVQIGAGNLVQVKNLAKAQTTAGKMLDALPDGIRDPTRDRTVWLITARTASEVAGGWGVKRRLQFKR